MSKTKHTCNARYSEMNAPQMNSKKVLTKTHTQRQTLIHAQRKWLSSTVCTEIEFTASQPTLNTQTYTHTHTHTFK